MKALLAGWVAGYAVSIAMTLAVTLSLLGGSSRVTSVRRFLPGSLSPRAVGVVVSVGGMFACTLTGLVLGAVYQAMPDDASGALGTPKQTFTLAVSGGAMIVGIGTSLAVRWARLYVLGTALVAAGAFGWLLPNLAER